MREVWFSVCWMLLVILFCIPVAVGAAAKPKVLVVFSYEKDFPWDIEIREGIELRIGDSVELHYYYMNTKVELDRGAERAAEAYELYRRLQPDGVIAADDNAQAMFVVPYLKDKVKTPVMFVA